MKLQQQINRINAILGHSAMTTCLDCNQSYIPMTKETIHICPFCQPDLLIDDDLSHDLIVEEVSRDNLYL